MVGRQALGAVLGIGALALAASAAAEDPKFKVFTVDVGTGLGVYCELPRSGGGRPWRIVYDTGKGAGAGLENDLVAFLVSPQVGLKPAQGDFAGDEIDFFVLSHPHEDHFNGAKPLFDMFDVRNVIESKQIPAVKYLSRFKAAAVQEIAAAKAAGKDAHYYVVGLPYPNGFDAPREGKAYDEYALAEKNLPAFLKKKIDPRKHQGRVKWPFGPAQVAQTVKWPVEHLLGNGHAKAKGLVPAELYKGTLEVDVIPVGTHFDLDRKTGAGFTVLHGDTIAALDPEKMEKGPYQEAFPYYKEADLNDGSVTIRVAYGNASVIVPGDTEGREKKPSKLYSLADVFSTGDGEDAYSKEEVLAHLRRDKPAAEQLPLVPMVEPYVLGSVDVRRLAFHSYVTYDLLTPEGFSVEGAGGARDIAAVSIGSPGDVKESMIAWDRRDEWERKVVYPTWKERLFRFHRTLVENGQKRASLKGRFSGWVKGGKPRLFWSDELDRFLLDYTNPVWTITNLVQLTERIFYVDPYLAHILAGFILRSDAFLEYLAPQDRSEACKRGERHMMDVAAEIKAESGTDILKSDVLFFGHHGSFTSSSLGFVLAVDPNVGVISADDKSYSGSTLPDFSAMFWNLNTHHPHARALLHSLFFHADMLAKKRGEPVDGFADRARFSQSAARIFRARKRWPIPIWRTDWNDDLVDDNTLIDNLVIESDGRKPIWDWVRHRKGETKKDLIPADAGGIESLSKYQYWFQLLGFVPKGEPIRPHDPSGEIRSFGVDRPAKGVRAVRTESAPAARGAAPAGEPEELEDWVDDHE